MPSSGDSTTAVRLDRIESSLAISQLPSRYAMALDVPDLDALVAVFVAAADAHVEGVLGSR